MGGKSCGKCNAFLDLSNFYTHSKMKDGYLNFCKTCVKDRVKARYILKEDYIKEYDKKRSTLPHRVQARKDYAQTPNGRLKSNRAKALWRIRNPEKSIAHNRVKNAIKSGILEKPNSCECCGIIVPIEAHHEDYSKPLDVMWVCDPCHKKLHRAKG